MPLHLSCPEGHRWEVARDDGATIASRPVVCPVCGRSGSPLTSADHDASTIAPPAGLPPVASVVSLPVVPGYDVLELLGQGGMGVVYKARHLDLNRLVALKVLVGGPHAQPSQRARFKSEVEALARLQHPNIVQIFDVGEHAGCPYFAMELVEGEPLDRRLAHQPQPPAESARLVELIARAVQHAHDRGILHRDLKPGNILLRRGADNFGSKSEIRNPKSETKTRPAAPAAPGSDLRRQLSDFGFRISDLEPKVTDFGLAKALDQTDDGPTRSGIALGTPAYMAPEQAGGNSKRVGPAADVYALGVLLYECLTGQTPFRGVTLLETLELTRTQEPVAPRRMQPKVPRDLDTICLKCLEKAPLRRYASAGELADDLGRFLRGEPVKARPPGRVGRAIKWARRRPTQAALVAVSVVSAVALLGGGLWYQAHLRAERDRAEHNFRLAFKSVNQLLTEVAQDDLAHEPGMEDKRRSLLEKALTAYRELLVQKDRDPAVRRQTGLASKNVADIQRLLGNHAEAVAGYTEAAALLDSLIGEFPDHTELVRALADCHNFRGESLRASARLEEAGDAYRAALRLQEALRANFPDAPDYLGDLARTRYNLGLWHRERGEPAAALGQLAQSADALRDLRRRFPDRDEFRQHLARARLNLGFLLMATDAPVAREATDEAIELLRPLTERNPRRPDYRHELATALGNRGILLTADRADESAVALEEASALLRRLADDYPRVPAYRAELANTLNSLATGLARHDKHEDARTRWEQAERLLRRLDEEHPSGSAYRGDLGMTVANLGLLLAKKGEWADARRRLEEGLGCLEEALRRQPDHPDYRAALRRHHRNLAQALVALGAHDDARRRGQALGRDDAYAALCFLGRCVEYVEKDAAMKEATRTEVVRAYVESARQLLREAGPLPALGELAKERDVESLRRHIDFATLAIPPR